MLAEVEVDDAHERPFQQIQCRLRRIGRRHDGRALLGPRQPRQVHEREDVFILGLDAELLPAGFFGLESQAQRIMQGEQVPHGAFEPRDAQALPHLKQDRLVIVVRVGEPPLEERMLNGRQRRGTGHHFNGRRGRRRHSGDGH